MSRYSFEILKILARSRELAPDVGKVFNVWVSHYGKRRKPLQAEQLNKKAARFSNRREDWLAKQKYEKPFKTRKRRTAKAVKTRNKLQINEKIATFCGNKILS